MSRIRDLIPNDPPDEVLIRATLSGDQGAFAILVGRYQKRIFRLALAIVRDEAEADAITQDTFVKAYTSLPSFEGRSGLETWLTRIAINKSRDQLRSRRWRFLSLSGPAGDDETAIDLPDDGPDAERLVLSGEISQAIDRAMAALSAQQKTIFQLRHYEDLPLEEIARLLNLRPGTVRAHLFRAIQKIRSELRGWGLSSDAAEGIA